MIRNVASVYNPFRFATTVVYMLQNTEYRAGPYLAWFWRTNRFDKVLYRRQLDPTSAARLLRLAMIIGLLSQFAVGVYVAVLGSATAEASWMFFGLAAIVSAPLVWAHLIAIPLAFGRWLIIMPREQRLIKRSRGIFANHSAVKIAVAGSYGKTTMKELLATVLAEGKKVAATPGNKNVSISHARFAAGLSGDEEVLIIEFGEGKPGDVPRFCKTTQPDQGVITGLAPAHLDRYRTIERAGKDIFALADYLRDKPVYANGESEAMQPFVAAASGLSVYSQKGVSGWRVRDVVVAPGSTSFTLSKGKRSLRLSSGLLGAHQIGPLSAAAVIALSLGLSEKQVEAGIAKTVPFEHRMQPYQLGGAWIIDDTYNGNLEGVRAGTALLATVDAKCKWYVTPGLVDQGGQTKSVHIKMGELIAGAKPDRVILMQNSATRFIKQGLEQANFAGEVTVESDPLEFYSNLEHLVAAGDVVLMQNDWTDNYA